MEKKRCQFTVILEEKQLVPLVKEVKEVEQGVEQIKESDFTQTGEIVEMQEIVTKKILRCNDEARAISRCLHLCGTHYPRIIEDNKYHVWHTNGKRTENKDAKDNEDFYGETPTSDQEHQDKINKDFINYLDRNSTLRGYRKRDISGTSQITQEEYDILQQEIKNQIQEALESGDKQ